MSEATNRVLEAQLRRQKQQKKRQKEWESALKPTTIDGSGVLRQLGQQPLDNRQILPNTASLNRPIRPTSVPGGVVADWLPRVKKVEPEVKAVKPSQLICLLSVKLPSTQHTSIDRKMLVIYTGKEFFKLAEYEEWDWAEYNPQNDLTDLGEETKLGTNAAAWEFPESSWTGHPGVRKTKSIASGSSSVTYGSTSHTIKVSATSTNSTTRYSSIGTFSLVKGFYRTVYAVTNSGSVLENSTLRFYGLNPDSFSRFHGWWVYVTSSTVEVTSLMSNIEVLMAEKQVEIVYLHTMKSDWFCWVRVREVDVRERFNLKITENESYDPADLLNPLPDGVIPISSWWYGLHSDGRSFVYKKTKLLNGNYEYEETIDGGDTTTIPTEIPIVDFSETSKSYLLNWEPLASIEHPDYCSETWGLSAVSNYKKPSQIVTFVIEPPSTEDDFLDNVKTDLLDAGFSERSRLAKLSSSEDSCSIGYGKSQRLKLPTLDSDLLAELASMPEIPIDPVTLTASKIEVLAVSPYF